MMLPEFTSKKEDSEVFGLAKLEAAFRPLTDEQRDIYWDRLKFLAKESFYKAVDYVIDVHKDKEFPKVAEILEATGHISALSSGLPEATGIKCDKCNDTGYIINDHDGKQISAKPCDCELGEKIKEGWKSHFKRGKK